MTQLDDSATKIPNLQVIGTQGENTPIFSLRGVSISDYSNNQSGPVATYYDEVYKGNIALTPDLRCNGWLQVLKISGRASEQPGLSAVADITAVRSLELTTNTGRSFSTQAETLNDWLQGYRCQPILPLCWGKRALRPSRKSSTLRTAVFRDCRCTIVQI